MDTPTLCALLRSWVPPGDRRAWALASQVPETTLRRQSTSTRPTADTLLKVGQAQARPRAEVSLAVALASGDAWGADLLRAVQGATKGLDGVEKLLTLINPEAVAIWRLGEDEHLTRESAR